MKVSNDRKEEVCPACSSKVIHPEVNLYDDRYGYPGSFSLARCITCGHRYLLGEFTQDMLSGLYTNFYPRASFNVDDYEPHREISSKLKAWLNGEYRSAFRWVPPKVRVLDIGCGFCETLGYHTDRSCDVYGVEADENVKQVAEMHGFKVEIGLFNPNKYPKEYFDYITLDQVIEHVVDPGETLQGIASVLRPGGKVVLSTPNANGWGARVFGKRWINWHTPYHLQLFSLKSMRLAAEKAGLVLEKSPTITSSDWLLFQWIHILTFPPLGDKSVFWTPNQKISRKKRIAIRILALLHKTKINHIITRLFDALGIGDNYVFFLRKG